MQLRKTSFLLLFLCGISSHVLAQNYIDNDHDGFGLIEGCDAFTQNCTFTFGDCDDTNPNVNGETVWYADKDGDGYYTSTWQHSGDVFEHPCPPSGSTYHYVGEQVTIIYGIIPANGPFKITYKAIAAGDCDDNNYYINPKTVWYRDKDKDGYAIDSKVSACDPGSEWYYTGQVLVPGTNQIYYFKNGEDCNDNNASIHTPLTYYPDADGDGFRSSTTGISSCLGYVPNGFTANASNLDCNDSDPAVWQMGQFYKDADKDWYMDGPFDLCYGSSVPAGYLPLNTGKKGMDCNDNDYVLNKIGQAYVDADGDYYAASLTVVNVCINPGYHSPGYISKADYDELMSLYGRGLDCDDNDPNKTDSYYVYKDADNDGYTTNDSILNCTNSVPSGYQRYKRGPDCNDNDANRYTSVYFYLDADGDGFSPVAGKVAACGGLGVPAGYSYYTWNEAQIDVDDNNANVFRQFTYNVDADNDGYPANKIPVVVNTGWSKPSGYTTHDAWTPVDCNDNNASVSQPLIYYVDNDGDGLGSGPVIYNCSGGSVPAGHSVDPRDCDDANASVRTYITWLLDADNDGYPGTDIIYYGTCSRPAGGYKKVSELISLNTDCNDNSNEFHMNAPCYQDADNDGYSSGSTYLMDYDDCGCPSGYKRPSQLTALSGDCNDNNAAYNPGAAAAVWYQDSDGDGFGNPSVSLAQCPKPAGYVADNTDCNDSQVQQKPGAIWYKDTDNDGVGGGVPLVGCTQPAANYKLPFQLTSLDGDCNDNSAGVGATPCVAFDIQWVKDNDLDGIPDNYYGQGTYGVDWYSGTCPPGAGCNWVCSLCPVSHPRKAKVSISDGNVNPLHRDCNNANSSIGIASLYYKDSDNDGYSDGATQQVCTIPGGYKLASALIATSGDCNDNNASITIATLTGTFYYRDYDNDGYGNPNVSQRSCSPVAGYVTNSNDCKDSVAGINPNTVWYKDHDNDGYSDGVTTTICEASSSYKLASQLTATSGDCDDSSSVIKPTTVWYKDADNDNITDGTTLTQCARPVNYKLLSELGAGTDCNESDPNKQDPDTWYKDLDNDGYGDGTFLTQCTQPANYKLAHNLQSVEGDCNDNNSSINPASPTTGISTWYEDKDNDGYGNINSSKQSCASPVGFVSNNTDCDDNNPASNPTSKWYKDSDQDGYTDGTFLTQCARPAGYRSLDELTAVDSVLTPFPSTQGVGLHFNQSASNYVSIPDNNNSLDLVNEFSIEAWIQPSDGLNNTIVDKGDYKYLFSHNPNGTTGLGFYRNGGWVYNTMIVPVDLWSHVAITYSVSMNEVKFYLNGVQAGTTKTGAQTVTPDNGPVNIGRQSPYTCSCNHFNGYMDNVRLWNRVLTSSEIFANYNKEIEGSAPGLVGNYKFNQGVAFGNNTSITTLTDASGNNNHGTLVNFTRNGNLSNFVYPAGVVAGTLTIGGDCNDNDPNEHKGQLWIKDADNDGYRDNDTVIACARPTGYKLPEELIPIDTTYNSINPSDGQALHFNGNNSNHLLISDNGSMDLTNNLTIEAWIKPEDHANNTIIGKGGYTYLFQHTSTNQLGFYKGAWFYSGTSIPIPLNTWTHVAVVYSVTNNSVKFFVNGVQSGATLTGATDNAVNDGNIAIGRQDPGSCNCNHFHGTMDELRVWDIARTDAEILSNYNKAILTTANGLKANFHFNHGVAFGNNTGFTMALDESGNNNHGTLTYFTRNGATSNWVTPGAANVSTITLNGVDPNDNDPNSSVSTIWYKDQDNDLYTDGSVINQLGKPTGYKKREELKANPGEALHFNESGGNYVKVPDNTSGSLDLGGEFTLEAWIKPSDNNYNAIVDKGESIYLFTHSAANQLRLYKGAWYTSGTSIPIPLNEWTHVAVTYSVSQNSVKFFVNGQQSGATFTGITNAQNDDNELNIGRQNPISCLCNFFNGSMDEVRIWKTVRTQSEIQTWMNKPMEAGHYGLSASYRFENGIASQNNTVITQVRDYSGKNNHGTLMNFTRTGATSNFVYPGAVLGKISNISNPIDCDDNDKNENPEAKWYRDYDGDTLGDPNVTLSQCLKPAGYVSNNLDVDDSLANTGYPDIKVTANNVVILNKDTIPSSTDHTYYGELCSYSSLIRTFKLENKGTDTLTLTSVSIIGRDTASFKFVDTLTNIIPPNNFINVRVRFTPLTLGDQKAQLYILSDDASDPNYFFGIGGKAISSDSIQIKDTICYGSTFTFNGIPRSISGTYTATFPKTNGCDSTITLKLHVREKDSTAVVSSICAEDSVYFNNAWRKNTGIYNVVYTNRYGCDSIRVLDLTRRPAIASFVNASICPGDNYSFNAGTYSVAGSYPVILTASNGCDSTVTLNLSHKQVYNVTVKDTICPGETYTFDGTSYNSSGTYTATFTSSNGCDSVVTLMLHVYSVSQKSSISGIVTKGGTNATNGNVILFKVPVSGLPAPVDTFQVTAGSYLFQNLNTGTYLTLYKCGLTCGSVPTYYERTYQYQLSDSIILEGCPGFIHHSKNIEVVGINSLASGPGIISGTIQNGSVIPNAKVTAVLSNVSLILVSMPTYSVVGYTESDASGNFQISNLPYGDYKLIGDLIGYGSDTSEVYSITASNATLALEICISDGQTLIGNCGTSSGVNKGNTSTLNGILYPNPTTGKFTIETPRKEVRYKVVNGLGIVIGSGIMHETRTELDLSAYSNGIYVIMLQSEGEMKEIRVVKQ